MCNHAFSQTFSRRLVASLAVTALSVGIVGANFIAPQVAGAFAPPVGAAPRGYPAPVAPLSTLSPSPVANAVWQTVAPVVDGNLDEWSNVQRYPLDNQNASAPVPDRRPQPNDLSAWASLVWTTDNLYVAVNVTDNVVVRTHRNWLLDDMAQFTLDIDNSKGPSLGDVYLTVSPDGLITNGGLLPLGYDSRAVKTATGWQAEVSIPLREFGADFLNDAHVGFTWGVQDNDGQSVDGYLVWAGPDFTQPTPQQGALSFVNGPTREWITARPGVNGYDGITDATLDQYKPTDKLGASPTLSLKGNENWNVVFKFVPPALPAGAKPLKARIHITVFARNKPYSLTAMMHRLLRQWDENTVTWNNASGANGWKVGGANGVNSDRSGTVATQTEMNIDTGDVVWELGPDVIGDLYAHPDKNNGFVMRAENGSGLIYHMYSSECTKPANCAPWIEVFVEKPPAPTSVLPLDEAAGMDVPAAAATARY